MSRHYYANIEEGGRITEVWSSPSPIDPPPARDITEQAQAVGSQLATKGGRLFWWNGEAVVERTRVQIVADPPRCPTDERCTVSVIGATHPVTLLINSEDIVELEPGEELILGWENPAVVPVELHPDELEHWAERYHIHFEEPSP